LPAWGNESVLTDWNHVVDPLVSSLYAHGIAAFARLVAENPDLHQEYATNAVLAANIALTTTRFFVEELDRRITDEGVEQFLIHHPNLGGPWTKDDCDTAVDDEWARLREEHKTTAEKKDLEDQVDDCKNIIEFAGMPIAHNENLTFAMALIETTRALDSDLYRRSPWESPAAPLARSEFPLVVSRMQRFFVSHLRPMWPPGLYWNHEDGIPSEKVHVDDTEHAAQILRYMRTLNQHLAPLDAVAANWSEPIPFHPSLLEFFASTFVNVVAAGPNLAENLVGLAASPIDKRNESCDGWLDLTPFDPRVYDKCYEISLRVVDGEQKYLGIGTHVGLLVNKRARFGSSAP
jgi:hypothetical protein